MKRRQFLAGSLAAGAGLWAAGRLSATEPSTTTPKGDAKMPFQQPPLPFAMTAMKPFLSEEQLTIITANTTPRTSRTSTPWSKESRRRA